MQRIISCQIEGGFWSRFRFKNEVMSEPFDQLSEEEERKQGEGNQQTPERQNKPNSNI